MEPGPQRTIRRKTAFLVNWLQNKTPGNLDLYKWKTETVQSCLHWLQAVITLDERSTTVKELEQMLQERLRTKRTRLTHQREVKRKGGLLNFIKVFHLNKLINASNLRQVLHDPTVTVLHPDPKAANDLQVCDKLPVPLLRLLGNFTHVAFNLEDAIDRQKCGKCPGCELLSKATDTRKVDGHLVALDPDFIPNVQVREWMAKGAKFRLNRDPRGMLVAVREGLCQYIELYLKANKCTPEDTEKLECWKESILKHTQRNLDGLVNNNTQEVLENAQMKHVMKQLQEHLVVVPVDKAGHNIAFVCQTWYAQKLKEELTHENGAYRDAQETVEDVLERHKAMNDKFGFTHDESFPYLYGILKAHKQPVQLRFIAGCSKKGGAILKGANGKEQQKQEKENEEEFIRRMTRERNTKPKSSLTEASKEGVKMLRAVMDTLREREEDCFKKTGVRKWWTVESIEEVALGIKDAEHKLIGKKMRTADFTTMYTKLPHQKLLDTVIIAWDRAVEFKNKETASTGNWVLNLDWEGNYSFEQASAEMETGLTKQKYLELLEFLITENHIWNGGELRKQVIGIPMGSPVSPHLANLFRYVIEAQYVEELLRNGHKDQALACEHTYGYIDDLCTFGGPLPSEEHYGIPMTVDAIPRDSVNFLGMKITANKFDRPPRLGIVEKQEEWNFAVIKYPHASSNIPWNQGAAVFKGQLIRYAVICNNLWDFQMASLRLAGRLIQRGHHSRVLASTWMKYLEERWPHHVSHKYRMQEWFPIALKKLKENNIQSMSEVATGASQHKEPPRKQWQRKKVLEPNIPESSPEHQEETEVPTVSRGYKETVEDIYVQDTDIEYESVGSKSACVEEENVENCKVQSGEDENPDHTQIFVNNDAEQVHAPEVLSESSTLQDLMDFDNSEDIGRCGKCDGIHTTETCPIYKHAPEDHPDAVLNKGKKPSEKEDITLPETMSVIHHKGDGDCLFHAMAHILTKFTMTKVMGMQLRIEVAAFIERNEQLILKDKAIWQWIADLKDSGGQSREYIQQLRTGMWGGTLEIQVVAHIYRVQFMVFTKQVSGYKCVFYSEPIEDTKGYLWYHRENIAPHYDSLEMPPVCEEEGPKRRQEEVHIDTGESSQNSMPGQESPKRGRRRMVQRNKLSLKKTTTEYNQSCGICGDLHTRRRTSILCICGQYVHLKCIGFRTVVDVCSYSGERPECQCKTHNAITPKQERADHARKEAKHIKVTRMRSAVPAVDPTDALIVTCIAVAIVTAQEQFLLQLGSYVRLHGLTNTKYNGCEGMLVQKHSEKAEVELAGTRKVIRVHCKNITLMPTYTASRCKLMKHQTVEITYHPEPTFWWPQKLTGTYYEYLRVERKATSEEIKIAFRKLSIILHPDKNPNNAEKATQLFQQVLEAYECLKDSAKRMRYDQTICVNTGGIFGQYTWQWQW